MEGLGMALEKTQENILKQFKKCIDERSLENMKKPLYIELHIYTDLFIAHYDIHGFKDVYRGERFLDFINTWVNVPWWWKPKNELHHLMREYVFEHKDQIFFEFENKKIQKKFEHLKSLANELGFDIMPKQVDFKNSIDLNLSIDENGQLTFC